MKPVHVRSQYDYTLEGELLYLEDLNGDKSLTNDMENALTEISLNEGIDLDRLSSLKIMYRDSMGQWDGVRVTLRKDDLLGAEVTSIESVDFFSLGGTDDFETAKYKRLAQD